MKMDHNIAWEMMDVLSRVQLEISYALKSNQSIVGNLFLWSPTTVYFRLVGIHFRVSCGFLDFFLCGQFFFKYLNHIWNFRPCISSPMNPSAHVPRLELIRQTSLHEEKISKNGQPYHIFVVVKNSPFQITCSLSDNKQFNFNNCSFDIRLVYDMEAEKEVAWVNTKPVDCKPSINDAGDLIHFEAIKIKVLSSHHEDNFFRVKIEIWDPSQESLRLTALSHPIKVISKPLKHRSKKVKEPQYFGYQETPQRIKRSFSEIHEDRSQPVDNVLMYKLDALMEEQRKMKEELYLLRKNLVTPSDTPVDNMKRMHGVQSEESESGKLECMIKTNFHFKEHSYFKIVTPNSSNFEMHMTHLLEDFSRMDSSETFDNVRNILRKLSARDTSKLLEFVDILNAAGLNEMHKSYYTQESLMVSQHLAPTSEGPVRFDRPPCTQGKCHHKDELNRLDMFYNEVFFD